MSLNYRQNDLFKPDHSSWRYNACVGNNGGPYNFYAYSLGYFNAAQTLAQAAIDNRETIDLSIYPIIYNYRHGVELGLKYFATQLPVVLDETIAPIKATHKLLDVWNVIRPLLQKERAFDEEGTFIPQVEKILNDIVQFDPDAEVFRFPADRKGRFYLQDTALINLPVISNTFESIREIFDFWYFTCGLLLEYKNEMQDALDYDNEWF